MNSLYADQSSPILLYIESAIIFHGMDKMRQQDIRAVEQSAASEVSQFMRRELGVQATASRAKWANASLTVTLTRALTPIGQATAQAVGGDELLDTAYDTLYHLHQRQAHVLISQVIGLPVRQSSIALDAKTGSFSLTFFFAAH